MTVRPYGSSILNLFDGFVLHLMIVVLMIPLIDSYDHGLLLTIMLILMLMAFFDYGAIPLYKINQEDRCFLCTT